MSSNFMKMDNTTQLFGGQIISNTTNHPLFASTIHPLCYAVDDYFLVPRFWLAVVFGISISIVSIIFNTFIFIVFVTSKQHRNSYNLYLLLLSLFDVFMGVSYIAVLSNKVLINWTASYTLKSIWVTYMVPMLTISHIAITASTYLITFAAIERYSITVNNGAVKFLQNNRKIMALIAVMAGVISKGTILEEVTVMTDPDCNGTINEWSVKPSDLVVKHEMFNKIWRFYFRNIFTILAPFFILLYLNARLIFRLQEHNTSTRKNNEIQDKQSVKQKKARIRAATRTLVIIVCTYLMSNLLSVIITIWEYLDAESLFKKYLSFYVLSVDSISLLTIVASCLRLPIYVTCQPLLKKEMYQFLAQLWTHQKMSRRMTLIENSQMTSNLLKVENDSPSMGKVEFV